MNLFERSVLAESGHTMCLTSRGLLVVCVRSAGRRGRVLCISGMAWDFPRWDHFWNQRVHFGALRVITHDDLAQQTLIISNHRNAFYTAW